MTQSALPPIASSNPTATGRAGGAPGRVLVVTRFPLSGKTAIGVQTSRIMDSLADALHLHWELVDSSPQPARSLCLEKRFSARAGPIKRAGGLQRFAESVGLRSWRGDTMPRGVAAKLAELTKTTRAVYVAPIGGGDARRMRQMLEVLQRPFILHVWDLLDGVPKPGSDMQWLIENAQSIWCLTEPMNEVIGQPGAPLLLFSRDDTPRRAQPPVGGARMRIALLGDVSSYRAGLDALAEADTLLKARGAAPEWLLIGPPGVRRRIKHPALELMQTVGFLPDPEERDAFLASCHLAFLPGPREDPSTNTRSRFSIPSRILDFTALGLPIVGMVHPQSATASFASELRQTMCLSDGAALAEAITRLSGPGEWVAASRASRAVFDRAQATEPLRQLGRILDEVSDMAEPCQTAGAVQA
jgi:hypothetical protein